MTRKTKTIASLILPAIICLTTSVGFSATRSELAQAAKRSPGSPKYEDICFSPRTFAALPCAQSKAFKRAFWLGFLCHGQGTAKVHLDNLQFTLQSE